MSASGTSQFRCPELTGHRPSLSGRIEPGKVFDRSVTLDRTPDAYRAMDERTALKVLIRP